MRLRNVQFKGTLHLPNCSQTVMGGSKSEGDISVSVLVTSVCLTLCTNKEFIVNMSEAGEDWSKGINLKLFLT